MANLGLLPGTSSFVGEFLFISFLGWLVIISIYNAMKYSMNQANKEPASFYHSTLLEVVWTNHVLGDRWCESVFETRNVFLEGYSKCSLFELPLMVALCIGCDGSFHLLRLLRFSVFFFFFFFNLTYSRWTS